MINMELNMITNLAAARAMIYLDPSAVTFALQIMIGVVVATGAAVGIIITKVKKKAKDKLGIDLEKKKEVEEDIVDYTEQEEKSSDEQTNK